jgi:small subunit ribosomal protein S1
VTPLRKPPQVLMIRKDEPVAARPEPDSVTAAVPPVAAALAATPTPAPVRAPARSDEDLFDLGGMEGLTMADLLGPDPSQKRQSRRTSSAKQAGSAEQAGSAQQASSAPARSVDDFDFDEEAFLAALDDHEPHGTTGEVVRGTVIGMESDGVYVDIGGKAPGFMPKKECGLGVITNLKERFPKGLEVEVLVTREQNADGMVTISARALALRQSWEKVRAMEKEGKVVQVKVNGFNRGGVTCDLEGLRGFIPRSQLQGGKTMKPWWAKPSAWPSWRSTPKPASWCCRRREPPPPPCFRTWRWANWWKGRWFRSSPTACLSTWGA